MDLPLVLYALLATAGLVQAFLFSLQLRENHRFARSRCKPKETPALPGHVQLFAPCKGHDTGLADNLRPLLAQDHPDYEVTFIVEAETDPAVEIIRRVMAEHSAAPARICVAGLATDAGQKVHNLRAATRELSPNTQFLAFVDSDARPKPEWLRQLTARLDRPEFGAVTGYRWFVPERPGLANYLLSNINAAVAGLIGPGGHNFVWGGSWAIRRETFDSVGIHEAWRGTLSDDLVVTRVLKAARLEIQFEPKCLVASPLDTTFAGMFEFARRQFLVGKFYSRRWWAGAIAVSLLSSAAFWTSVLVATTWLATGHRFAWMAVAVTAALWASHAFRAALRQQIPKICLPEVKSRLAFCRWLDILAAPVCGLVSLSALLASIVGRSITWRGIRYEMRSDGRIASVVRLAQPAQGIAPEDNSTHQGRRAA